jgi:hypothetical protein
MGDLQKLDHTKTSKSDQRPSTWKILCQRPFPCSYLQANWTDFSSLKSMKANPSLRVRRSTSPESCNSWGRGKGVR